MFDHIYLTGFGKFPGVEFNPTELIANYAKSLGHKSVSVSVLDVTVAAVNYYVNKIKQQLKGKEDKKILFLHFGVGSVGAYFLQNYCYNNKDFRIPDNDGYAPKKQPITNDYEFQHRLSSSLNLDILTKQLESSGFKNKISADPGRYLCNYIYFSSLHELKRLSQTYSSLFIHVPSHDEHFSQQKNQLLIENLIKYFVDQKIVNNLTTEIVEEQEK